MKIPNQLHYTKEHLWTCPNKDDMGKEKQNAGGVWLAGITDYAQDMLGDIVFIEPPKIGEKLINMKACGVVESVKTGSDLHAPMNGVVTEINSVLLNAPEEINEKPYAAWIFKFIPDDVADNKHFLTAEAYKAFIEGA